MKVDQIRYVWWQNKYSVVNYLKNKICVAFIWMNSFNNPQNSILKDEICEKPIMSGKRGWGGLGKDLVLQGERQRLGRSQPQWNWREREIRAWGGMSSSQVPVMVKTPHWMDKGQDCEKLSSLLGRDSKLSLFILSLFSPTSFSFILYCYTSHNLPLIINLYYCIQYVTQRYVW